MFAHVAGGFEILGVVDGLWIRVYFRIDSQSKLGRHLWRVFLFLNGGDEFVWRVFILKVLFCVISSLLLFDFESTEIHADDELLGRRLIYYP